MPFPRRLLIANEELILDLRPHPVALALPAIATVVGLAVTLWLSSKTGLDLLWWALFLVGFVAFPLRKLVSWLTSNFAVTNERVIHRQGLIAKRSMEIPLEAINDVRFEQGIFDRMVGAGTLVIQSASEAGRQVFDDIRHPEDVQKTIYEQGEANKKRMYQGGRADASPAPPAPAMPPVAPSTTTELERLGKLRADGVLTEEEFQAQKAKILGQG
jgi:membrane protein YdbS with pleckstrin-like domain